MSFKESVAKARAEQPEPALVPVAVGEDLYEVEVTRLPGMEWSAIMVDAPPTGNDRVFGFDLNKGALLACQRHARLLDAEGEPVDMSQGEDASDPWEDLFDTISGQEVSIIAATWWALNVNDPNQRVVELKKSLTGGGKTS